MAEDEKKGTDAKATESKTEGKSSETEAIADPTPTPKAQNKATEKAAQDAVELTQIAAEKRAEADRAAAAAQAARITSPASFALTKVAPAGDAPKAPKGVDQETFEAAVRAIQKARLNGTTLDVPWDLRFAQNPALAEAAMEAAREGLEA